MEPLFIFILAVFIIFLVSFIFSLIKESKYDSDIIRSIDKTTLKDVIKNNPKIQLVDVRTAGEIREGIIEPAVHIDVQSKDFANKSDKFKKDQPIYLYCRSGMRSMKACKILRKNGFTEIYNLKGGYLYW